MSKPALLLLHGAIGASKQLQPLAGQLATNYDIHLFDFPGHGGTALPEERFSIQLFSEALRGYIETHHLQQPAIFGYSMGGYVAMFFAKHYPHLVGKIATLGTKFHWDEATAAKEVKMLDAATITAKVPAFAAALAQLHAPNNWEEILQRTAAMLTTMGKSNPLKLEDYSSINNASLIMLGDRDKMVTLEETVSVYKNLPAAQMAVLPATAHPIEQADPGLIAYFLEGFFK